MNDLRVEPKFPMQLKENIFYETSAPPTSQQMTLLTAKQLCDYLHWNYIYRLQVEKLQQFSGLQNISKHFFHV